MITLLSAWHYAISNPHPCFTLMLGGDIVGATNTLSTDESDRAMIPCGIIGILSCAVLFIFKTMSAIRTHHGEHE